MYYEQPYCFCRVALICASYPYNLTPLQPYSQQSEETLLQIHSFQITHDFMVRALDNLRF